MIVHTNEQCDPKIAHALEYGNQMNNKQCTVGNLI